MKRQLHAGFAALSLVFSLLIIALIVVFAVRYLAMQSGDKSVPTKSPIQRAKSIECLAQIRKIEMQIQLYSVQNGRYPENLGALEELSESDIHCPVTQDNYMYDPSSGHISCPAHTR